MCPISILRLTYDLQNVWKLPCTLKSICMVRFYRLELEIVITPMMG